MNMIPNEVIEQIRDYDIVSILEGEGLELKRDGSGYKCCCPFHGEKTPSFVVSPSRNTAHCFGSCAKSWDAIAFVQDKNGLTFMEAVEYLAAKLHIQYEKKEPTPAEREEQFRREKLMNVNRAAHEWFQERFAASPAAKQYCRDRGWSDDTIALFGVGYAPEGGGLLKALTDKGWGKDVLIEAGLASVGDNGSYDAFRQRIVFPIWSRSGYIAGFTGRYIGENEDTAKRMKYLNTKDTPLFHKGEMLFGWYQASRQVSATGTVVLCEGNPDVMRLHQIGVSTAAAPCGTALTKEQIDTIRRKAKNVILAGDMDEAGRKAVRKHGIELLSAGLAVRVMEWEKDLGKDPDEYFKKNPKGWDEALSRDTSDFIPWYCSGEMKDKSSQTEIAKVISDVSRLLAWCDETAAEMYLESFTKQYKNGKVWRQEYYKAKNALDREALEKDRKSQDMLRSYGFYIKNRCYYGAGSSSNDRPWSNFIMEPVLHIRDESNARRIFRVLNESGQEQTVKFKQSEMVSFADFKRVLESAGNYVWKVSAAELTQLKTYLYDDTPSADEIRQLGWQKRWGFYAWGNGGMDGDRFEKADKYGVFMMKDRRFYLPGCAADTESNTQGYQMERKFTFQRTSDITLREHVDLMVKVHGENAKVAVCFLVATLFKDIVTSVTQRFPILNLFGPKGTGKTQLGASLTSFFFTDYSAPNLSASTKAALAEAIAEVSNAVVHLDEYKKDLPPDKQEILKGLWDGTGRTRVNIDNDKRRETTSVDCGVVLSGQEMPTADIALFSRMIFLSFSKTTFSDEEKRNFENLRRIENRGITHLTAQMLAMRSIFAAGFRSAWDDTVTDLSDKARSSAVEDRTLKNWATVLAAFRTLDGQLGLSFHYPELLDLCTRLCINQNAKTRQSNELAGFWETVENLVGSSRAWIDVDYRITRGGRSITTRESKRANQEVELNPEKRYLFVNFNRLSSQYLKEARDGQKALPKDSLKYYLENSPEYMGTVLSMKFKLIDNALGYTPSDDAAVKTRTTTAMVFDYDAITENYGISLDVVVGGFQKEEAATLMKEASDQDEDDMPAIIYGIEK